MKKVANDATEVVVGANGRVWVASTTSDAPTDVAAAMTTLTGDWTDLGYISEDGATFTEGKEITDINAWQSFYPIRRIITARSVAVSFALRQWSRETIEFALGGTVAANTTEWKYTPPAPEALDERSITLEWEDGTKSYRLYIPRGIVSENVETQLVRTAAADLAITFAATDPGVGVDIYTLFTDDPAFGPTS